VARLSLLAREQRVALSEQACSGVLVGRRLLKLGGQLRHLATEGADELSRAPLVVFLRLGALWRGRQASEAPQRDPAQCALRRRTVNATSSSWRSAATVELCGGAGA
jgi:hypothetical protein